MASCTRRHAVTPVLVEFPPVWGEDKRMMSKCLKCVAFLLLVTALRVGAQGTAFTYQGDLATNGTPATGAFDFRFAAFDSLTNGFIVSGYVTNSPVGVTNGLFTTTIDFGSNIFTGPARWLDLAVRSVGATNGYTGLFPRQPINPVPYAIFASGASNLVGALAAGQLTGTIGAAQISGVYTGAVSFSSISNTFAGAFTGNGSGVTNLNGSQISTGTVADARLSTNVAFLNGNQTFSGANTMSNWNNSFTGSFYGNGLVGWNTVSSNTINAVIDHGYVLTNAALVTVNLPASPNVGDIIRLAGAGKGGWVIQCTNGQSILGSFLSYNGGLWNDSGLAHGNWTALASSADGSRIVATEAGTGISVSYNNGSSWASTNSTTSAWHAIASSADGSKLVAAVYSGGIYSSSGAAWAQDSGTSGGNWTALASSANGNALAATAYGGYIWTSTTAGASWTQQTGSGTKNRTTVACSASGTVIVAAATNDYIYYSLNSGSTWNNGSGLSSLGWDSVACSADGTRMVAAASNGGVYTSTNSGANWTHQTSFPLSGANAVATSSDGAKIAAAVNGGGIYVSSDLGATWSLQNAPVNSWIALSMSADGSHIAAAANGSIGSVYVSQPVTAGSATSTSTTGLLYGGQGSAVELQYIGNSQYMPVSSAGQIWAY